MHLARYLVFANRRLAGLILLLPLAMKLIVPVGFMPSVTDGRFTFSICSGAGPMVMAMPGMDHGKSSEPGQAGKSEPPCAFSGLAAPALAAADAVLLAIALLFVMALGMRAVAPRHAPATPHLRPFLRGPPAKA